MSMTVTVSRLDSFRYWRGNEDATTEDWLKDLSAPPNHRMDVGAAFQTVLENLSVGGEFAACAADGISFNFKCDAAIPQLTPVYGQKDYGSVLVRGKAGIVDGKRVEVFKTTKCFEAEKRQDGYQWRLYLDLFDADEFVWNIFVIAPNNPDETSYDVMDYHRLTAHRYPGLHDDCVSLVNDYHGIMSSIPEEDFFMASTGRGKGKAKALPREPEMLTIHGDIVQETEDAILVNCGADKPVWLAKSQIEYAGERDDLDVEIRLPDWMAEEKGVHDGQRRAQPKPEQEGAEEVAATPTDVQAEDQGGTQDTAPTESAPACHFKGDVTSLGDGNISLTVTSPKGKEKTFTFSKDTLRFEGDDVADLQVGYKSIDFVLAWDIAVESGLAKHLKLKAPNFAPESSPAQEQTVAAPAVPETAADSDDDEAPKTKHCKNRLRSETITDYVKLTDAELASYGREMSEAMTRRTEHKETAAHYSRLSRDAEKEAYKLNDIIQAGHEEREIDCDVIGDFNTGEIVYVEREYPHREIRRQSMTDKDRQLLLPIDPPAQPQPEPETAVQPEPEAAAEPEESETVTLCGEILEQRENETVFRVHYGDEANSVAEFIIPNDQIQMPAFGDPNSTQDMITLTRAYAIESEIIAAPEEEPAREGGTCENCKHGHDGEEQLCMLDPALPPCENFSAWERVDATVDEKSCASCAHRDVEDGTACAECGDDLSNFTPLAEAEQGQTENAGAVQ